MGVRAPLARCARSPRLLRTGWALLCAASLACSAGAGSRKSGSQAAPKRSVLLTESDDVRVGEQASREVSAQLGLLDDASIDAWVGELGRKLLRGVPRRSFQYHFAVVDQFEPNAFALPGGYVFVSRGLLALANSEDELANVIGHEITHVAQRHAAAQQELARRAISLPWQRAAQLAGYSREMEREADRGGQMLAAAAGYDPMGMSSFLGDLGQMETLLGGAARQPTFTDTHPGSYERAAENSVRSHELRWRRDPDLGDTRASYLRRIEGLPLGDRPEAGLFEGDRFLHPDLGFEIRFPAGWRTSNTASAVGAVAPRGDGVVFLAADLPAGDPRQVAEDFAAKTKQEQGLELRDMRPVKLGAIDAWRMELEGRGAGGSLSAMVTVFPYRGATWRINGLASAAAASEYRGRMLAAARSFRPVTPAELGSLSSTRLALQTARAGEDLVALGRRTGNAWDPSRTAVLNGLLSNHRFAGGEAVKTARVEPYRRIARADR